MRTAHPERVEECLAFREVLVSFIALVMRVGRKLENDAERIASLMLSSRARLGVDSAKA